LIVMGAIWTLFSTVSLRMMLHFFQYQNFNLGRKEQRPVVIVGSKKESDRVMNLLMQAQISTNLIGTVAPSGEKDSSIYLSEFEQLDEVVHIYKIQELIFCSKDIPAQNIMKWMTKLGTNLDYKIVPEESLSIIGSSSKNTSGELYTIDIRFQIATSMNQRNKRMLDILLSLFFILFFVVLFLFVKNKIRFLRNIFHVLVGNKTWVGYAKNNVNLDDLPTIKTGILSPLDALKLKQFNIPTIQRLNFLYAKDYETIKDLDIVWKGFSKLGS